MSVPTLYLLCGLPFSGKSTLARRLCDECSVELVSLDAINEERGLFGEDGLPVEEWEATNLIARERVEHLMRQKRDIVVDDTNCYRWLRDRWRALATANEYESLVVYLPEDPRQLRERIASSTDRRAIAAEVFEECVRTFQAPFGEPAVRLETPEQAGTFVAARKKR